jgi:hypothetical protein
MTVLEPTPDSPRARTTLLRRLSFITAALALTVTFALTLSGIASTQGTLRPDGQAATIASHDRSDTAVQHHDCPRGAQRSRGAARRV